MNLYVYISLSCKVDIKKQNFIYDIVKLKYLLCLRKPCGSEGQNKKKKEKYLKYTFFRKLKQQDISQLNGVQFTLEFDIMYM